MNEKEFAVLEEDVEASVVQEILLKQKLATNKKRELTQMEKIKRQNELVDKDNLVRIDRAERAALRTLGFLAGLRRDLRESNGAKRRQCRRQLYSRGL